eukprot:CAMPEP_0181298592 /NCGR_PEP_ID=MMETSP1101-20121128/5868_1 /TAXON_ID=46948 /ORGANISM="Rhodomonas abbreviata, Strain Caron Lab Isolate" /LENGTH=75 /DNA_ID=CAMNT_0023403631 /DNA_START=117 /DNA_END=345 /DNA_ORIENTATION=+
MPLTSRRFDSFAGADVAQIRQFVDLKASFAMLADVNTIDTWAAPHNASGITPNTPIDSNDSPPGNNQQREEIRGY